MERRYDIFISYRRVDSEGRTSGRDIARTIKLELEKRGFEVFFDYSEIKDNEFEDTILPAIHYSKVFIIVLSKDALLRCVNEEDWVRREIETAIKIGCKIIPISPDSAFNGWPTNLPDSIIPITKQQVSDISMGSLFEKSIDKLTEERIGEAIKKEQIRKEDISLSDVNNIVIHINKWVSDKVKEVSDSWGKRNLLSNLLACFYILPLLFLLITYIEILTHRNREFSELSYGYYVVSFLYGLLNYFLNRRDGIYALLLGPIIVLPVGYIVYVLYLRQSYYIVDHLFDSSFLMFLFSIPFLLSLLLKKDGKTTWNQLQGGLLGLFKWKRHIIYYLWCVAWIFIVIYKFNHYHY